MILDSKGNPMVRKLGFVGGLEPESQPKSRPLVSAIGFDRVWPEEDGAGIEASEGKIAA